MTFLVERLAELRRHLDHLRELRPKVEGPESLGPLPPAHGLGELAERFLGPPLGLRQGLEVLVRAPLRLKARLHPRAA